MQIKNTNINTNILTFDPNGKIIKKNLLANINIIKRDLPKPKLEIKDNNLKSNTISTERVRVRHSLIPIKEKLVKSKSNNKPKSDIIFNPKDKVKLFDFETPRMRNNGQEIQLSGNNFELVKPEIGVIISNENANQKKEGGFDYLKKYNKPSMNEYNKLSYNSQNSINFLSSYMPSYDDNIINNNNENQNYIGYKEEFSENNNPLLQDGYKMPSLNSTRNNNESNNEYSDKNNINVNNFNLLQNRKKLLKIDKNKNQKGLIHSYDYYNNRMNSNRYKSSNSIKLNDNLINSNLQNIFNENEEKNKKYNSIENDSYSYLKKKNYILGENKKYKKRRELPLITETNGNKNILDELVDINKINKFNFRIIKNKKWGNDNYSDPIVQERNNLIKSGNYLQTDANTNIFRKDNINNRIKDSGINILNIIRERKKNNISKIFLKPID